MELRAEESPDGRLVRLPEELTISSVAEVAQALAALRISELPTVLDLSGIEEIDGAGLQLLMTLREFTRRQGVRLRLRGHSFPVLRAIELSGTAGYFGDRLVIPPGRRSELPFRYGTQKVTR